MTTTSNTINRQKVTLYNTCVSDMIKRIKQIQMVQDHTEVSNWKRKLFFWIIKLESKTYKALYSENELLCSEIYI